MKEKAIALLSILILALSCTKSGNGLAFLQGEERNFTCDYSQQTLAIEFEASDDWRVSIEYQKDSNSSWILIEPRNGNSGKNKLTVKLEENTNTIDREATINILCHNKSLRYTIFQTSKSDSDNDNPPEPIDPTQPDDPFNPDIQEEIDPRKFIKSIEIICFDKHASLISSQSISFSYDEFWRIIKMSIPEEDFNLQYANDHILFIVDGKAIECELVDGKLTSFQDIKFNYSAEQLESICDIPIIWSDGNAFTTNGSNKVSDIKYSRDFSQTGNIHLTIMCIFNIIDADNAIRLLPLLQYGLLGERSINAIERATIDRKKYIFNYLLDNYDRITRIDEFTYDTAGNNFLSRQYRIEYMP